MRTYLEFFKEHVLYKVEFFKEQFATIIRYDWNHSWQEAMSYIKVYKERLKNNLQAK
jgi:hypothetical protein